MFDVCKGVGAAPSPHGCSNECAYCQSGKGSRDILQVR